jgi:hypothetical protein
VATAADVATVRAAGLFPVAQLETSAVAAASAPDFNAVGRAMVVVVRDADDVLVVAAPSACVDGRPPVGRRWTYANPNTLRAKATNTTP